MKNKIVIIGTGFVGTTTAYSLLNSKNIDEIVLIDANVNKAEGEEIDLLNGQVLMDNNINIHTGNYNDCTNASIVVITAGTSNKGSASRLELVKTNSVIVSDITKKVIDSGFDGIFITATNPVDIISYVIKKVSNFDKSKVIGTGTLLDTARLRYVLSKNNISINKISPIVIGEHGDSSVIPWDYIKIDTNNINKEEIHNEVINMGYDISTKKGATYYGIANSINKIIKCILEDSNEVLPVSTYLDGQYGNKDLFTSVPCIINKDGIKGIINIYLSNNDKIKFDKSCNILKQVIIDNNLNKI